MNQLNGAGGYVKHLGGSVEKRTAGMHQHRP